MRRAAAAMMEFDRFRIAVDGGEVVGVAGSYELQMTMPGGRRCRPAA